MTVRAAGRWPRAVRIKSLPSTASIEARVMRAIGASEKIAERDGGEARVARPHPEPMSPASRLSIR